MNMEPFIQQHYCQGVLSASHTKVDHLGPRGTFYWGGGRREQNKEPRWSQIMSSPVKETVQFGDGGLGARGYFRWLVRNSLSIGMTFGWRYEGREDSHEDTWGKSISGSGNSMYKGLEVGTGLAGAKRKEEGRGMGWEVGGHVLGGWARWEQRQFSLEPVGGAVSLGLLALGGGQAGKWESRYLDLWFVIQDVCSCPLGR